MPDGRDETGLRVPERRLRSRERAIASAELVLSLAELLRGGTLLPPALTAIAARRRHRGDTLAPLFERIATGVRDDGLALFEAVAREKVAFTPRLVAILALANLGGPLFRTFVRRLREFVHEFNALPPAESEDFPAMRDEVREFCFFFGHLVHEKASQPEIQRWLPLVFTPRLRLATTHLLARFYDQGLLLSEAFRRTPPFQDPEMVVAVEAGEAFNRLGLELIELADWLAQRRLLEERLRLGDFVSPPTLAGPGPAGGATASE